MISEFVWTHVFFVSPTCKCPISTWYSLQKKAAAENDARQACVEVRADHHVCCRRACEHSCERVSVCACACFCARVCVLILVSLIPKSNMKTHTHAKTNLNPRTPEITNFYHKFAADLRHIFTGQICLALLSALIAHGVRVCVRTLASTRTQAQTIFQKKR